VVSRNVNVSVMASVVGFGGVCIWREFVIRRLALCWRAWQESGFSRREDVSTLNSLYKGILHIFFQCDLQRYC
jgi:hypothetical protein